MFTTEEFTELNETIVAIHANRHLLSSLDRDLEMKLHSDIIKRAGKVLAKTSGGKDQKLGTRASYHLGALESIMKNYVRRFRYVAH